MKISLSVLFSDLIFDKLAETLLILHVYLQYIVVVPNILLPVIIFGD